MNKKEILKKIKDIVNGFEFPGPEYIKIDGLKIEQIAHFGREDLGSTYWDVIKVTEGTNSMFVKIDAYYDSWSLDVCWEYSEPYEVEEYEKIVKDWREVK